MDGDLEFFRAWLRSKYAISSRSTKVGAENEDFELIATQFNAWVKGNTRKVHLKDSNDYYFFIVSDFDFYSDLFIKIYEFKNHNVEGYNDLYINNFYPIADLLYYPLILAPISKIDDDEIIREKILLVNKFIDIYTNVRMISSKSITQSTIRYYFYDLIKEIRNSDVNSLRELFSNRIFELFSKDEGFKILHQMNNWGYYHYFYARILYNSTAEYDDFWELVRSRKQSSFVLHRIFSERELVGEINNSGYNPFYESVANFVLIRRYHLDEFDSKRNVNTKIKFLLNNGYLNELPDIDLNVSPEEFINLRGQRISNLFYDIWRF